MNKRKRLNVSNLNKLKSKLTNRNKKIKNPGAVISQFYKQNRENKTDLFLLIFDIYPALSLLKTSKIEIGNYIQNFIE